MADPDRNSLDRRAQRPEERRRRTRRRRAVLGTVAVVLVAGAAWRLKSAHDAQPRLAVVSSRSALVGTWRAEDGPGQVEFTSDGRFSAVSLTVDVSWNGELTGAGSWSLDHRGGALSLRPDHPPTGMSSDAGFAVVRADGQVRLCVTSASPGVLCDALLRRVAP
ncbi:hypothetical protein ACH5A3_26410 [Streptomyces echinatus]|uniref:hypothetical protein n=1 Tax=Streptomyces echinatus TaxID=67293 RepID=UPI0037A4579C